VEIIKILRSLMKWLFSDARSAVKRKREDANLKSALIVRERRPLKKRNPSKTVN